LVLIHLGRRVAISNHKLVKKVSEIGIGVKQLNFLKRIVTQKLKLTLRVILSFLFRHNLLLEQLEHVLAVGVGG